MGRFCCAFLKEQRGKRSSEDASQRVRLWTGSSLSLSRAHTHTYTRSRNYRTEAFAEVFYLPHYDSCDILLTSLLLYIPALREISVKEKQCGGV